MCHLLFAFRYSVASLSELPILTCEVMDFLRGTSELADQMPVTYLIKFKVVPERRDEFLEFLDGVLDSMRGEAMFQEAIPHKDPAESR